MTRTRSLLLLLAVPASLFMGGTAHAIHVPSGEPTTTATTTSGPDDGWIDRDKFETCELFGYRAYAHRVAAGEMHPGMWDELVGNGWSLGFTGPTSPVLVSPHCD